MNRRRARLVASIGFVALVAMHFDFWRRPGTEPVFGWIPGELVYRIAFIVLAWLYMLYVCGRVWQTDRQA